MDGVETNLAKCLPEILREEGVQKGIYATAAIGQHVSHDLNDDIQVGQLVHAHRFKHENYLWMSRRRRRRGWRKGCCGGGYLVSILLPPFDCHCHSISSLLYLNGTPADAKHQNDNDNESCYALLSLPATKFSGWDTEKTHHNHTERERGRRRGETLALINRGRNFLINLQSQAAEGQ